VSSSEGRRERRKGERCHEEMMSNVPRDQFLARCKIMHAFSSSLISLSLGHDHPNPLVPRATQHSSLDEVAITPPPSKVMSCSVESTPPPRHPQPRHSAIPPRSTNLIHSIKRSDLDPWTVEKPTPSEAAAQAITLLVRVFTDRSFVLGPSA
jgi:hypothetical protein